MGRERKYDRLISTIRSRIDKVLLPSPLATLGRALIDELDFLHKASEADQSAVPNLSAYLELLQTRLEMLPSSFGARFNVDAAQLQAISDEWRPTNIQPNIIPSYDREWGHWIYPTRIAGKTVNIAAISFPGREDIDDIDLLDYPWLLHELGHNLHHKTSTFAEAFRDKLIDVLSALKLSCVADRGVARERSQKNIHDIGRFWMPDATHKNWSYEIAVDLVALWVSGPAYLQAFSHFLRDNSPDPFHITQDHPPYYVRVCALLDGGERLCWADHLSEFRMIQSEWSKLPHDNRFLALAQDALISAAVTCGLACCQDLQLPRLQVADLRQFDELLVNPNKCEFGTSLIVAAWYAEQNLPPSDYARWHSAVVDELVRATAIT